MERGIIGKDYHITVRDSVRDDDLFDEEESEYLYGGPVSWKEVATVIGAVVLIVLIMTILWIPLNFII